MTEERPLFRLRPMTVRILQLLLAVLVVFSALEIWDPTILGKIFSLVDFHVFHLAGELTLRGDLAEAYVFESFHAYQKAQTGADDFMPWTYPPHYNLVMAALALMPVGLSYLVFITVTLGLFLWVIKRLAGVHMLPTMIIALPAVAVTIRCGQNGLLIAALIGAFCLMVLKNSDKRGIFLGLMAVKPHLAVAMTLHTVMTLQIRALLWAAAFTAAALGIATWAFGPAIWGAFLGSVRDSSAFLEAGAYPLYRMSSVYAGLRSFGAPSEIAFAAQTASALAGLALVAYVQIKGWEIRRVLGVMVLASTMISPYNYDYDLSMLAVAFALVMPDMVRFAKGREIALIFVASWVASGSGLVASALRDAVSGGPGSAVARIDPVSTGMFGILVLVILVTRLLARAEQGAAARPAAMAAPAE
ncbi:glycosyltransferase family 87 protein [Mesobacterium pallidum]|uniref:glycosyltransferase family 87 protein n=1 Tax=Mesobacterium pallidum TaxID=2872037 RepID=UPI001EE15EB4|nr:glycosyltransferase family 87 protein [Mesobacterium pallidum]